MELHGGTVGVRSEGEGNGTTFYFELPVFEKPDEISAPTRGGSRWQQSSLVASVSQVTPAIDDSEQPYSRETMDSPFTSVARSLSNSSLSRKFASFSWLYGAERGATVSHLDDETFVPHDQQQLEIDDIEDGFIRDNDSSAPSASTKGLRGIDIHSTEIKRVGYTRVKQTSTATAQRRQFLLDQLQSPDSIVALGLVEQTSQRRKLRVMVVDDTASTRKIVMKLLVGLGHKVEEASDGLQFLQKMGILQSDDYEESSAAVKGGYDFILMDDNMPKMCGPDATAAARSAGYTGLIFGLTGNTDSAQLEAYKAKGADMVFTKPLNLNELQEAIKLKLPGRGGL